MIRFKKIKKTSDDKIHLEYEKTNNQGRWDEHSMKSAQEPAPSFSPLVLNTPHKIEEPYAEGADDTGVMTSNCLIDLRLLADEADEAEDYLNGKRRQGDLFAGAEPEEPSGLRRSGAGDLPAAVGG